MTERSQKRKPTMTAKILTFKTLKGLGACKDQLLRFKQLFGDKVNVTAELCNKHCDEFDWNWAAENLLPATAWAEYDSICAPALAEYHRICAPALAELYINT